MWITVYTQPHCPQCDATTRWLTKNDIPFDELPAQESLEGLRALGHGAAPVVTITDEDDWVIETWSGYRPGRLQRVAEQVTT